VAQALRGGVRPFDTVSRWGGEEFSILLSAPVHAEDVATVCERLRSLVERMARRASFLKTCAILLGLSRVKVAQCDLAAATGDFDVVTFRAVAPLPRFFEDIGKSGVRWRTIMAYKGREERAREEIQGVRRSAGAPFIAELHPLRTPFLDEERCLAVISVAPLLTNG
jgi:16S rRNA G527 N7-methylase RsmG